MCVYICTYVCRHIHIHLAHTQTLIKKNILPWGKREKRMEGEKIFRVTKS